MGKPQATTMLREAAETSWVDTRAASGHHGGVRSGCCHCGGVGGCGGGQQGKERGGHQAKALNNWFNLLSNATLDRVLFLSDRAGHVLQ